jgi:dihydroorotate dehydrogenase (fumarate)
MNLESSLMGIGLKNPMIVGSSSLTNSIKNVKKCEEAGAAAVVLKSLYEEQILNDSQQIIGQDDMYQWYPEAMNYVKSLSTEHGLERYLELIKTAKATIDIPVFASVNCFSDSSWVEFTRELENAGADAIELNIGVFPGKRRPHFIGSGKQVHRNREAGKESHKASPGHQNECLFHKYKADESQIR